jgi:hypothetical protein
MGARESKPLDEPFFETNYDERTVYFDSFESVFDYVYLMNDLNIGDVEIISNHYRCILGRLDESPIITKGRKFFMITKKGCYECIITKNFMFNRNEVRLSTLINNPAKFITRFKEGEMKAEDYARINEMLRMSNISIN